MNLTIDGAGRVVLPKPVRNRLGLHAGSTLELTETAEGVTLTPVDRKSPLARKGSFLVYTGEVPAGFDVVKAIEEEREARDRKIRGFWRSGEMVFRYLGDRCRRNRGPRSLCGRELGDGRDA
jgi:AbrB family looped-hinge helix DNA binding protein